MPDLNLFEPVFQSQMGYVRIYKIRDVSEESRAWVEEHRRCQDGWYCPGQYPPALEKALSEKRDFPQGQDFNQGVDDAAYQQAYLENLQGGKEPPQEQEKMQVRRLTEQAIDELNQAEWGNSDTLSQVWELIRDDAFHPFMDMIIADPRIPHLRSEDGRGPLCTLVAYFAKRFALSPSFSHSFICFFAGLLVVCLFLQGGPTSTVESALYACWYSWAHGKMRKTLKV